MVLKDIPKDQHYRGERQPTLPYYVIVQHGWPSLCTYKKSWSEAYLSVKVPMHCQKWTLSIRFGQCEVAIYRKIPLILLQINGIPDKLRFSSTIYLNY